MPASEVSASLALRTEHEYSTRAGFSAGRVGRSVASSYRAQTHYREEQDNYQRRR